MTAYYNEFDPKAAQWLRNLIEAGLIAPGDVDERSIADVTPNDVKGYTQCHFFAGIGVWSYALRAAGWPDSRPAWTASCPCQPFSQAGERLGFDDERHLWPALAWLAKHAGAPVIFGEQVASKAVDAWIDLVHANVEAMDYAFGAVPFPAAGVGAPHIRDRLYWVAYANNQGLEGRGQPGGERGPEWVTRPSGLVVGLADSPRKFHHWGWDRGALGRPEHPDGGDARGLVNADGLAGGQGCAVCGGRVGGGAAEQGAGSGGAGGDDRLADDDLIGCFEAPEPELHDEEHHAQPRSCVCGLAYADRAEPEQPAGKGAGPYEAEGPGPRGQLDGRGALLGPDECGPTNGLWRAADWIWCRDAKWRPVEPGTLPLVDGAPGRVVRLRAYGNAVNAEAAKAFIEAFLETERDGLGRPDRAGAGAGRPDLTDDMDDLI